MSDGRAPVTPHFWQRTIVGWHLAFWAMVLLGLLTVLSADVPDRSRLLAVATLVLLGLAYLLIAGPIDGSSRWRGYAYLSVAVLTTGVISSVVPVLAFMLFIVYPQVWLFVPRLRSGVLFSALLSTAVAVGFLNNRGWSWRTVRDVGPEMIASTAFSILLGWWISRLIEQSRERAELIGELEAARAKLAGSHHAQGVMAERERMAREIHDTLAQGFASVVMLAQAAGAALQRRPETVAGELAAIEAVARENLAEARALVAAFSPAGLDGSTLPDAIRRLADDLARQTGAQVQLEVPQIATGLARDQEVVLLRSVQEALTNVRRHAGARLVSVRLIVDAAGARAEVRDDGVGFQQPAAGGFGLSGMRSRVTDAGGQLDVASAPDAGTQVVVRLPARAAT